MDTEDTYERIEKYLDGRLSSEEKEVFENELETNTLLRDEVKLHREVAETLRGEKIHEFRDVLKKVDSEWNRGQSQKKNIIFSIRFKRMAALAATILLLVVVSYPFIFQDKDVSNEALFADNFEPYKMILNQRSISDNDAEVALLNQAIVAYEGKNYGEASSAFQQLQTNNTNLIALRFYTGLSELGAENTATSIDIFKEILATRDHLFIEQSRWYLSLAYLQKGDRETAKLELEKIVEGAFKYDEAKEILNVMN